MAKKKAHRKYRPKVQQQTRKQSPVVERLKLINRMAPIISDAAGIRERIEERKERKNNGSSGSFDSGSSLVH